MAVAATAPRDGIGSLGRMHAIPATWAILAIYRKTRALPARLASTLISLGVCAASMTTFSLPFTA